MLKKVGPGLIALMIGSQAFAVDYAAAVTASTTEVNSAITAALPLAALVLSAVIGWKLFKRFAKG